MADSPHDLRMDVYDTGPGDIIPCDLRELASKTDDDSNLIRTRGGSRFGLGRNSGDPPYGGWCKTISYAASADHDLTGGSDLRLDLDEWIGASFESKFYPVQRPARGQVEGQFKVCCNCDGLQCHAQFMISCGCVPSLSWTGASNVLSVVHLAHDFADFPSLVVVSDSALSYALASSHPRPGHLVFQHLASTLVGPVLPLPRVLGLGSRHGFMIASGLWSPIRVY
ncbi:hypothetical protein R1flu_000705 [Riccia fluitans]|uniref:Uncharacterized protein n=1 Tax=Riccia fluitans TaxID=41844 RepID=A0ABD1Y186_9MARC